MFSPDLEAAAALREARGLINDGWMQGRYREKEYKGFLNTLFRYHGQDKYCAMGAIYEAGQHLPLRSRMERYLEKTIGGYTGVISWNDQHGRTKEQVLEAFEKAAELAEGTRPDKTVRAYPSIGFKYFEMPVIPDATFMEQSKIKTKAKKAPKEVVSEKKLDVVEETREFVNNLREEAVI